MYVCMYIWYVLLFVAESACSAMPLATQAVSSSAAEGDLQQQLQLLQQHYEKQAQMLSRHFEEQQRHLLEEQQMRMQEYLRVSTT